MRKCGIEPYDRAKLSDKEYFSDFQETDIYRSVSSQPIQVLIAVMTLIVAVVSLWKK